MELTSSLADLSLASLLQKSAIDAEAVGELRYGFQIAELNFVYDMQISAEVVKAATIYSVPNTPAWMRGLINLRGSLVPVFNLEKYLDFKSASAASSNLLMVLGKAEKAVALGLQSYPELLKDLTPLESIPKLPPKIDGYIVKAYQGEKTWLELDKEKFFSTLGEKVCA